MYSPLKLDVMGACILIQRLARRRIARKQFKKLENKHLSSKLEGVRIVLYEKQREEMAVRAKKQKDTTEEIRNRRYLEDYKTHAITVDHLKVMIPPEVERAMNLTFFGKKPEEVNYDKLKEAVLE